VEEMDEDEYLENGRAELKKMRESIME